LFLPEKGGDVRKSDQTKEEGRNEDQSGDRRKQGSLFQKTGFPAILL
jgi:hypothetical protein